VEWAESASSTGHFLLAVLAFLNKPIFRRIIFSFLSFFSGPIFRNLKGRILELYFLTRRVLFVNFLLFQGQSGQG
jgi:hypothetical protein